MNTKHSVLRSLAWLAMAATLLAPAFGQDAQPAPPAPTTGSEDPVHTELRALKANLLEAIKSRDIEAMLKFTTPEVVVTWQNNEVCRGHDDLRKFYAELGADAFKAYKVEPTADTLTTTFGGDAGVVAGHSVGSYSLFGKDYEFDNRWTAAVVKKDGQWLLASYHVSLNALDNPILNTTSRTLYYAGAAGLVLGLIIGLIIGRKKA